MNPKKTIAIVAGEASGDLLGSMLMSAIRQAGPDVRFIGIGGPKMRAIGMDVLFPLEKLAVNGYLDRALCQPLHLGLARRAYPQDQAGGVASARAVSVRGAAV